MTDGYTNEPRLPEEPTPTQGLASGTPPVSEPIPYTVAPTSESTKSKRRRSVHSTVIETLLIVAAAFAIAMLVQTFMFRITGILQRSMEPTIYPGDRIVVNCLTYHFREPERGDIVVVRDPEDPKKDIIKRVIAVGGETIELLDGILYIDGELVDEPYVVNEDVIRGQAKITIPEDYVYIMGDNRPASGDSRGFGTVAEDDIIGNVVCVMWPIDHWEAF